MQTISNASPSFLILTMIFFHIIDDYFLQAAILANLKQKSYWEKHAPEPIYKNDYIVALIMHAFSWTFMVQLPLAFWLQFQLPVTYHMLFITNVFVHACVDHAKANLHKINLVADQTIHILQIIVTYIFTVVGNL